ncbi:glycosyltransferase family 4 protein [Paracoccus tegillarcae]|uniref:Glycosyl transferase n=1 Tax=Paracoccus tegillarcae TaxID=1529068 RepID=A0A2K9EI68_9RHOB|nr:glycosyltransferase family 4 protein [Paracoccus tegillarcae]AUH33057.1 glycosyl transferase [Paracoccus tegillarcae]
MGLPSVVHLVDDTTAGGVMRVVDHIITAPAMAEFAQHSLQCVDRGRLSLGRIKADVIVSHLAISWRSLPVLAALKLMNPHARLVHVEHSYTENFVAHNVTHERRFAVLLRIAYRLFDRVVAVSRAQGNWLVSSGAVPAARLSVIQSCVDLSAFLDLDRPIGPIRVIGAVGRLERQKGFDTLITAFRQTTNPDIALHIFGEGAEEQRLRNLASGDPRIAFFGLVAPIEAMGAVDAVAMPSRWEAYGLVAIEALAAGRALLTSDVDGLKDHLSLGAIAVQDASTEIWRTEIERLTEGDVSQPASTITTMEGLSTNFSRDWQRILHEDLAQRPNTGKQPCPMARVCLHD